MWPAESHIREEPWDSGLSHAIFNPGARHFCSAGVTGVFEGFFFFFPRKRALATLGVGVKTRTQLVNHFTILHSDGANL